LTAAKNTFLAMHYLGFTTEDVISYRSFKSMQTALFSDYFKRKILRKRLDAGEYLPPINTYTLELQIPALYHKIFRLLVVKFGQDTLYGSYEMQMMNFDGLYLWERDGLPSRLQAGCMHLHMRTPRPVTCTHSRSRGNFRHSATFVRSGVTYVDIILE